MTKENNIRAILETHFSGFREDLIESAVKKIMSLETQHGKWTDQGSLSCRCSECGCKSPKEYRYCPNCGAKMVKE